MMPNRFCDMDSGLMRGLLGGFGICAGLALLCLFYAWGMLWISENITNPFWRQGLMIVGGIGGIGASIGALAGFMEDGI